MDRHEIVQQIDLVLLNDMKFLVTLISAFVSRLFAKKLLSDPYAFFSNSGHVFDSSNTWYRIQFQVSSINLGVFEEKFKKKCTDDRHIVISIAHMYLRSGWANKGEGALRYISNIILSIFSEQQREIIWRNFVSILEKEVKFWRNFISFLFWRERGNNFKKEKHGNFHWYFVIEEKLLWWIFQFCFIIIFY